MLARVVLAFIGSVVLIGSTAHAQHQMSASEIQRHNEMVLRLKKQTKWHAGSPPPTARPVYLAPDGHAAGSTEAAHGVVVHVTAGHVEARPPEWPPRTVWLTVRAPLKAGGTDLAGCVFHIEGRRDELLVTLDLSMRRDEEKKEGVFDVIIVPELAKKARLTFSYTTETEVGGRRVASYYALLVRDYMPKVQ